MYYATKVLYFSIDINMAKVVLIAYKDVIKVSLKTRDKDIVFENAKKEVLIVELEVQVEIQKAYVILEEISEVKIAICFITTWETNTNSKLHNIDINKT